MLRKILLSSILILAVGCDLKSFKNGVYEGLMGERDEKYPCKLVINNSKKVEYINQLYFSQANMGKKKARYCLLPKPNLAILSSRHPRQFVPYHRGRLVSL